MNSFFRNLRNGFLNEGNTSKYLKYAIGEIILVVIGILIALQVNNWNENRKTVKLRKEYTTSIISDFEKDSVFLSRHVEKLERDSIILKSFQDRLQLTEANPDTIAKLFRHEFPLYIRPDFSFNNTTLINIIGNNTVSYPKDLRESMASLIKIQKDFEYTNRLMIDKYFDLINRQSSYPFENYFFDSGEKMRDIVWANTNESKLIADFEQISDWKAAYTQVFLNYARGIQKYTADLKDHLIQFEKQ